MTDAEIRAKIAAINIDVQAALDEIASKHGLDKLARGRCTFTDNGFDFKVSAIFSGGDTKEMAKLRSNVFMYGLKDEACNATIKYGNDHYALVGMKQTKMVLSKGGKEYLAPIEQVVNFIKNNHPELCI